MAHDGDTSDTKCTTKCAVGCGKRWRNFKRFMYKPETGQVMDRTASEWAKLILYFIIFYGVLAGFFVVNLLGLNSTLNPQKPYLTGRDSLLRLGPGVGFRPMPSVDTTLIRVKTQVVDIKDKNDKDKVLRTEQFFLRYVQDLDEFFKAYDYSNKTRYPDGGDSLPVDCNATHHSDWNRVCKFNVSKLGPCAPKWAGGNGYGYDRGEPCILLKMNRIFGWLPRLDENHPIANWSDLTGVPENLTTRIQCRGEHAADTDNLAHLPGLRLEYYPSASDNKSGLLPNEFFPFLNQKNYLQPVVMVRLLGLPADTVFMMECVLNGTGIVYDKNDKMGAVKFEVIIETPIANSRAITPGGEVKWWPGRNWPDFVGRRAVRPATNATAVPLNTTASALNATTSH